MFYNVFHFLTLCCRDTQRNWFQIMALPTAGTVLGGIRYFVKNLVIHFCYVKNNLERTSGSSETCLFNLSYNIDPSNKVIRRFNIIRFFC